MAEGALAGLRVLECGELVAAAYAAKLLGQFGADVIKIEPTEGDPLRRRGPFPAGKENPETGGLHLFLDQAKRSLVLDLETAAGQQQFRRLAAEADVLLASGSPARLERRGLCDAALREANPNLIVTLVTPFGLDAAEGRDLPMREISDLAAGGWLWLSPGALEDPALPPLKPFGQQGHYVCGLHAAIATLAALAARDSGAGGQLIDISAQAAIASQVENAIPHYTYDGVVASRLGNRIVGPWGVLHLADGLLFLVCVTEEEWRRLLDFLGNPEWAESPLFADRLVRGPNNDAVMAMLADALQDRPVQEIYHALQARRVPCAPVNGMADVLASEHLRARGFFVAHDHPDAGTWTYPGAPWQLSATPWQAGRRAPRLGEHDGEVLGAAEGSETGAAAAAHATTPTLSPVTSRRSPTRLPLAGVRVADFTWVVAGPVLTMQLAHLGADVIKIESATRLDTGRAAIPPFWKGQRTPNTGGFFNQYSQGKRSLQINARHPRAMEILHELIRRSDIVADNFGAGVMPRMGLGYEELKRIKPDIIQISMAGFGQSGPQAAYVGYGPVQIPLIGLMGLTGYRGGPPREVAISYIDYNAGLHGAVAVLAALHHRRRSGEGQFIDMSQWEAAMPLIAEGLLSYQMTGEQPPRMESRDAFEAPQGVYPCAGEDRWLALACWSDGEWQALVRAIGRADLAADATLASRAGRKAHEDAIDAAIGAWTREREAEQAAAALRAAGIAAQVVQTPKDLVEDPRLAARDFWVKLPHPECTGAQHAGLPWHFSRTPLRVRSAAPALGQHTDEVLREVIGLSPEQIAELRAAAVFE
ncbi:MAG TPA: CoA transferase [Dehalococcoidia bacterium]|nr:CoA transferase [Dehalococcoidia bacterium]